MGCDHNRTREISRHTVDCGVSGVYTWIRYQCLNCGHVVMGRLVNIDKLTAADQKEKKPRKRRKSPENLKEIEK